MAGGMRERVVAARLRASEAARRQVLQWVFGPEAVFPGDPRRRVLMDHTNTVDFRAVQYNPQDGHPIQIGKYTGITHTAILMHGGMHRSNWVSAVHAHRANGDPNGAWEWPEGALHDAGPIVIGCDVLVAYQALIFSGVTIGHGAIVAARAVVTKDVEPYSIVGGNPARHLKWRFDEPTREALLRIAWWDWPEEKVARLRHEIDSPDVQGFVERHDPLRQRTAG